MRKENLTDRIGTGKALFALLLGILIMLLAQGISSLIYLIPMIGAMSSIIFALVYVSLAYLGVRLVINKVIKLSIQECRIIKPNLEVKWIICAIVLPMTVTTILIFTPGEFVYNDFNMKQIVATVFTALFVAGFAAGVVEEIIFRGLIMTAFEKRWGKGVAVFVPSIIFGLLHAIGANLGLLDLLLLIVGGTSVGIMFSLIVYAGKSIWSSALVHGVWNIIMIGNIINIGRSHNKDAIFSYDLFSDSFLLAGGKFGVEASIVAILGYLTVIALILYTMKKKHKINIDLDQTVR